MAKTRGRERVNIAYKKRMDEENQLKKNNNNNYQIYLRTQWQRVKRNNKLFAL